MKISDLYIKILILLGILSWHPCMEAKEASPKKFTVVIDAGHGGKDIGASDNGVMEKNINLKVAKQLESLIKKKLKNTNVVMTRNEDTFLTLQQRADKANKSQGDLFISIHTNSIAKSNRNRKNIAGSAVYTLGLHKDENNLEVAMRENSVIELEDDYRQIYSGFDPQKDESYIIFEMAQKKNLSQSINFAENLEKELIKSGRKDRGVHQAGFWVLWATSMPSVLVELDFICNPESAKYMSSDNGAKELAEAIFKAVQKYEQSWSKNLRLNARTEFDDTYSPGDESELEQTYVISSELPVATARTRSHKIASSSSSPNKNLLSGERRRRNSKSREISLNQSYENDGLYFPVAKNYGHTSIEMNEELAQASTDTKSIPSKKSEKKKKEKVKKNNKKENVGKNVSKNKRRDDAHNGKVSKLVKVYKIQLLASTDLLSQDNSRFCGLKPISRYKENNLYKYYYGESTNKDELEMELARVKEKIPDAFIVESQKSMK